MCTPTQSGQILSCIDCRNMFMYSDGEAKFYRERGLATPKRCKPCRAQKKANIANGTYRPKPQVKDSGMPGGPQDIP